MRNSVGSINTEFDFIILINHSDGSTMGLRDRMRWLNENNQTKLNSENKKRKRFDSRLTTRSICWQTHVNNNFCWSPISHPTDEMTRPNNLGLFDCWDNGIAAREKVRERAAGRETGYFPLVFGRVPETHNSRSEKHIPMDRFHSHLGNGYPPSSTNVRMTGLILGQSTIKVSHGISRRELVGLVG